jgi:hypothetical protein
VFFELYSSQISTPQNKMARFYPKFLQVAKNIEGWHIFLLKKTKQKNSYFLIAKSG